MRLFILFVVIFYILSFMWLYNLWQEEHDCPFWPEVYKDQKQVVYEMCNGKLIVKNIK